MSSVPFTFRMKPEMKESLDDAAKALDRTPGYLVSKAVENYLAAEQEKETAILEAVRKADDGLLVPSEVVDDWLISLKTDKPLRAPKSSDFS